eukprot:TRINITY_DN7549_c0_g1_i6.p1 TRINITY_DN7549_c0_g1~~TRINITY_DN7549_c0_g1_i6.p1  ORF type:complete len:331 (-),score=62.79 TRINITY_DN7549_c0_g1_i6:11-1003(-)
MEADPDWELHFYETDRLNDQEIIVRPLPKRATRPADLSHDSLLTQQSFDEQNGQGTHPHHEEENHHEAGNPRRKSKGRASSAQTTKRPQQHSAPRSRPNQSPPRITHSSSESVLTYHAASAQNTRQVENPPKLTGSVVYSSDSIPGWSKLDVGNKIFDFLSPSRLHGSMPSPEKKVDTHHLKNPLLIYRKTSPKKSSQKDSLDMSMTELDKSLTALSHSTSESSIRHRGRNTSISSISTVNTTFSRKETKSRKPMYIDPNRPASPPSDFLHHRVKKTKKKVEPQLSADEIIKRNLHGNSLNTNLNVTFSVLNEYRRCLSLRAVVFLFISG